MAVVQAEVRLLGAFRVRRGDGAYVGAQEWRTTMTRSLLALVALHAPNPVPLELALETIWPGVDPARSRARLRTAASQIRKAVGHNCLQREGESLVLRDVWVDVEAFSAAAAQVRRHLMLDDTEHGLRRAREALALYADDVCADWPYAEWIEGPRARLRQLHLRLLLEAAEASAQAGLGDEAIAFGERAAVIDPAEERAARVLMGTYQHRGETERALLSYERCRAALAERYGADPSEQTLALHRALLRRVRTRPAVRFTGRDDLLTATRATVQRALATGHALRVHVQGPPGAGKSRFLDQLAIDVDARVVLLRAVDDPDAAPGWHHQQLLERLAGAGPTDDTHPLDVATPTVVLLDDAQHLDEESSDALADAVSGRRAPLVVVTASRRRDAPRGARVITLGPLRAAAAGDLLGALADGQPIPSARVQQLLECTGGLPGPLLEEGWRFRMTGLLTHVAEPELDADRVDDAAGAATHPAQLLDRVRRDLSPASAELLDLLAVLGAPADVRWLRAHADRADDVTDCLAVLADRGVLRQHGGVWSFADDAVRTALVEWLRPSVRMAIQRRLAADATAPLDRAQRIACALGGAAGHVGGGAVTRDEGHGVEDPASVEADLARGRLLGRTAVPAALAALRRAVQAADRTGEAPAQVAARAALVRSLVDARQLPDATRVARAAVDVAEHVGDQRVRALALLAVATPRLWAGDSSRALATLDRAWAIAPPEGPLLAAILRAMARALHDTGRSEAPDALELARSASLPVDAGPWHRLAAEVHLDRGDPETAAHHLREASAVAGAARASAVVRAHVLTARVDTGIGDVDAAASACTTAIRTGLRTGALLHVAEAAARLASLQCGEDPGRSRGALTTAIEVRGRDVHVREQTIVLTAQAEVLLALGQTQAAASLAAASLDLADGAGLAHRAGEAAALLGRIDERRRHPVCDLVTARREHQRGGAGCAGVDRRGERVAAPAHRPREDRERR